MQISDILVSPGEHRLSFDGLIGNLDGFVSVPESCKQQFVALIGHPHSLQGGTMNNKVVTTLVRLFSALRVPSIRFNFRGVGESSGVYDDGLGESEDMLYLAQQWRDQRQDAHVLYAGFSFGSYVVYRAASLSDNDLLLTIAPPVNHFDFTEFSAGNAPWIIAQGDHDDVVAAELVQNFSKTVSPTPTLIRFPDAGHFFHGQLLQLKSSLIDAVSSRVIGL